MSVKVSSWVWEHADVTGSELVPLLAMADWSHDDGTHIFPTVAQLSVKCRLSNRSIQRLLQELTRREIIRMVRRATGRGQTNEYAINVPWSKGDKVTPIIDTVKGDRNTERVTNSTVKGDTPRTTNRYKPLIQPSMLSSNPEWFETLAQDPRWAGANPGRYIKTIEDEYGEKINLDVEAHAAYEWLQTPAGQKKKVLRGFWTNWLKKAVTDLATQRPARSVSGGRVTNLPTADELRGA